ncbi:AAA family ATPase [Acinetobacter bereziniae]|nr:AAA family ATPase [Acinetobacter bereziniae]
MNTSELFKKIKRIQSQLTQGLVEREQTIKLTLLAALAGEHILLIGPPGTGKSLVSRRLHLVFQDTPYFERLLTKFSVPEELFGPLSIQALEKDQYIRLTQGYLPQASIAFLDEIFKANSAILNALLTLLNEREFDNGVLRQKVPLISVIGASNELPEDGNLSALYDRFLFRQYVEPVSKSGFKQLLTLKTSEEELSVEQLSYEELKYIQQHAKKVELSAEALQFLMELRRWCAENQIQVSDRRWRKIVGMLQVSAFTNDQRQVTIWDCWLVQHCIWSKPEQIELVSGMYEQYCGKSVVNLQNLLTVVGVLEKEAEKLPQSNKQPTPNNTISTSSHADENINNNILIEITVPIFPDSVADGTIATWHVEIGDQVVKDQVVCDIETDKVVLEVVAPHDGMLYAVLKDEGETVLSKEKIGVLEIEKQPSLKMDNRTSNPKSIGELIRAQMNN